MSDVNAYLDLAYTKTVTRDEDGYFIAEVRELPGCVAHGSTEIEAITMLRSAQISWIQGVLERGKQPPLPRPEMPSGKFMLRLPRILHRRLIAIAEADETSLNQLVIAMLADAAARWEVAAEPTIVIRPGNWGTVEGEPPRFRLEGNVQPSTRYIPQHRETAKGLELDVKSQDPQVQAEHVLGDK